MENRTAKRPLDDHSTKEISRATRPRLKLRRNTIVVFDPNTNPDYNNNDTTVITFLVQGLLVQVYSSLLAEIGTFSQTGKLLKDFRDVGLVHFVTVLVTLLGPEVDPPACLCRDMDNTPVPPKVWQKLVHFLGVFNFQGLIAGINSGAGLCMYAIVALPLTSLSAIKVITSRSLVLYFHHNPEFTDDSWLSRTQRILLDKFFASMANVTEFLPLQMNVVGLLMSVKNWNTQELNELLTARRELLEKNDALLTKALQELKAMHSSMSRVNS